MARTLTWGAAPPPTCRKRLVNHPFGGGPACDSELPRSRWPGIAISSFLGIRFADSMAIGYNCLPLSQTGLQNTSYLIFVINFVSSALESRLF